MRRRGTWILAAAALLVAAALPAASPSATSGFAAPDVPQGEGPPLEPIGGVRYLHVNDAENTAGIFTHLSHPLLNGHPEAIVLVTPVWNPLETEGVYNDHPVGVLYDVKAEAWEVYNEDLAIMPEGAGFHVLIVPEGPFATVHLTDKSNVADNYTDLHYPALDLDLNARVFTTHNNVNAAKEEILPYPLGVWYDETPSNWSVFLEAKVFMAAGLSFNIAFGPDGVNEYGHVADGKNTTSNWTVLDHPDLNGNPRAWLLVTHNYSPAPISLAEGGIYVFGNLGVYYEAKSGRWAIYDQAGKGGEIPLGAAFNVLVDPHPSIYIDDFESGGYLNWSDWAP